MGLFDHNQNAGPAPEKIKRDVLGLGRVETVWCPLPNGGEIWTARKPGGLTEKYATLQGDVLLLIFQGADKLKVAQALGIQLPDNMR